MCDTNGCKNDQSYFYAARTTIPVSQAIAAYYLIEKAKELLAPAVLSSGVNLIKSERERQISEEGWTPEHDDSHRKHEMALAAMSYVAVVAAPDEEGDESGKVRPCHDWPWANKWWKPSDDPIRNLVKAGALIAAEIDRIQRIKNLCPAKESHD